MTGRDAGLADRGLHLIDPIKYGILWAVAGVLMTAHLLGYLFLEWDAVGPVWWLAGTALVALALMSTVEYAYGRWVV